MGDRASFPLALLVGLFVAVLAIPNIIAVKLLAFGPLAMPTALIVLPITRINRRRGHRGLWLSCRPPDGLDGLRQEPPRHPGR
jgi:hypothetical protein